MNVNVTNPKQNQTDVQSICLFIDLTQLTVRVSWIFATMRNIFDEHRFILLVHLPVIKRVWVIVYAIAYVCIYIYTLLLSFSSRLVIQT